MDKHSLFLIQEDERTIDELMREIDADNFEIIGRATNGKTALEQILALKPEMVITEIMLAGIDGLGVIEKLKALCPAVKIVVFSAIANEEIIKVAISKGANYYIIKPTDFSHFNRRILEQFSSESSGFSFGRIYTSLDEKISKIFISCGIPPHIKGYTYLREGVKMAVYDPTIINSITKQLYPKIGKLYDTSPSKVERAIRHAIEVAWNRGRIDSINTLFGVKAYVGGEKPTNGEFIALVADKMLLEGA